MERDNVLQRIFDEKFSSYKEIPIGIYGTGNNAEMLVKNVKGYSIECMISMTDIGELFHGIRVISLKDALKKVKVIIIAATPSSTSIVFNRIMNDIPSDVEIFDMKGKKLSKDLYINNPYWNVSEQELKRQIDEHEVISFDVFDTLIERKTLTIDDFWKQLEEFLLSKGIEIQFADQRRNAELYASKEKTAPSIEDIYEVFKEQNHLDFNLVNVIKNYEIQFDLQNVIPRTKMLEVLDYAKNKRKTIVLTSDMYYSAKQIKIMLQKCGIELPDLLLISCEEGASKKDGSLFQELKQKFEGTSILHIGDNYEYDYLNASKNGIDSFWIMGHYEMLCYSSIRNLLDSSSMNDRKILGVISAELFNNPFVLCKTKGKVVISEYRHLAVIFLPVTLLFLKFIEQQSKRYELILFPSRDGWFLYEIFCKLGCLKTPSLYFYTSRSGISSAIAVNEDDFILLCDKLWTDKGQNVKKYLESQFQIEVDESFNRTVAEVLKEEGKQQFLKRVLELKEDILNRSTRNHENYMRFIDEQGIMDYRKIAVVDIVTHGTLIQGISKLVDRKIDLIALGTSNVPNRYIEDMNRVNSIYGNVNVVMDNMIMSTSDLSELHLLIEILYSSKDGQFLRFDDCGRPEFLMDSAYDTTLLECVQNELGDLVLESYSSYEGMIDKDFALDVLNIVRGDKSYIVDELRDRFKFGDPYDDKNNDTNILYSINRR